MTQQERITQNLVEFARDEQSALGRVRFMKRVTQIGGWVVLVIAFTLAYHDRLGVPAWVPTGREAVGGAMVALGQWFENTRLTWRLLRQDLDLDRLREHRVPRS